MKVFYLPDLGEGLAEAEVREWYIKIGDEVEIDQPLVSMETAKAIVDVPSPYTGKVVKLYGEVNDIIKTGAPLISFETTETLADQGSVVGKLEIGENKWDDKEVVIGSTKTKTSSPKAMPAARLLATQMNVDLTQIKPSGPQDLITLEDVKQVLAQQRIPSASTMDSKDVLHGVRRVMAGVMSHAHQQVVPVTITEDADITDLPSNTDLTAHLLKAMVIAAKKEPALNAWFEGATLERKLHEKVHIGLAIDTSEGLFVPVIKNVEGYSLEELRQIIDVFKKQVSARSLAAADMQGATLTLSNFGTMVGRYATPIIVPPTVAILGCGRSREVVLPRENKILIGRILPLSLTIDHRAVTGGEASRFLGAVIDHLQT